MQESTTPERCCRDCSATLVIKPGGGKPRYCPDCKLSRNRTAAREYQRRRKSGAGLESERYPCPDCPSEVVWLRKGPRPDRCLPCREAHTQQYQTDRQRAKGHLPTGQTITILCAPCGRPFDWVVKVGRRPWKCGDCLARARALKNLRNSAAQKLKRTEPDLSRVCVDCDAGFQQRSKFASRAVRCPACSNARAERLRSKYQDAMSAALATARQVTFEINGRWSECSRCGASIQNARYGVRQWCDACLPVREREVGRAWRLANPGKQRELVNRANRARRARLKNVASEPFSDLYIFERDRWICQLCKKRINKRLSGMDRMGPTIDHQIPIVLGGPDTAANAVASHRTCNTSKGCRYLPQGEQLALLG